VNPAGTLIPPRHRRTLAEIAQQTRAQFTADDRVRDATVSISFAASVLLIDAMIFTGTAPFRLTAGVSSVGLEFLKVA
jgi:hypothetical protein